MQATFLLTAISLIEVLVVILKAGKHLTIHFELVPSACIEVPNNLY